MAKTKRPSGPGVEAIYQNVHKLLERVSYRHNWGEVFSDFVSAFLLMFAYPLNEEDNAFFKSENEQIFKKYNEKESKALREAIVAYLEVVHSKFNPMSARNNEDFLFDGMPNKKDFITKKETDELVSIFWDKMGKPIQKLHIDFDWYDGFGHYYEWVSSTYKNKMLGQFFTPVALCNLMAQVTMKPFKYEPPKIDHKLKSKGDMMEMFIEVMGKLRRIEHPYTLKEAIKISDPSCGSGRTLLAANCMNLTPQFPPFMSGIDLDIICAKMSVVNFALHGVWGEVIHGNTLSWKAFNAWRIVPHSMHKTPGVPTPFIFRVKPEETYDFRAMASRIEKDKVSPKNIEKQKTDWAQDLINRNASAKGRTTEEILSDIKSGAIPKQKKKRQKNNTENNQFSLF